MSLYEGIKDVAKVVQQADNIDLYLKLIDLSKQALDLQAEVLQLHEENTQLKREKTSKKLSLGTKSLLLQEVMTPFSYTIVRIVGTTKGGCSKLAALRTEHLFVHIATHPAFMTTKRKKHMSANLIIFNINSCLESDRQNKFPYCNLKEISGKI